MKVVFATLLTGVLVTAAAYAQTFGTYTKTEVYKAQWEEAAAADKVSFLKNFFRKRD